MSSDNMLSRRGFTAVSATTSFFVIFQILIIIDQKYSSSPLCPYEDVHYAPWYWYTNYSVSGAFGITCLMLFLKLTQSNDEIKKVPYAATFCLVTLGLIATLISLLWNWGGICLDVFGVASPAAIWGEWMSCGPLLLFITITLVDRPKLTRNDIIVIVSFFISIAAGFIIIIKQPIWLASIWLAISVLAYLPMFWLSVIANSSQQIITDVGADEFELFSELSAKKNNLCVTLIIILPMFTIIYFLALFRVIDAPMTITCYQILSVLTKGLFAAVAMDAHLELLNPATRALIEEKRANEARRAFLRFIFHEVRTPLNSLTMGIEILERSERLVEAEIESLSMMRDASSFMTETLNDVLSMQKIEEGKLELELSPFSIRDSISKVRFTLKGLGDARAIRFEHFISADVPNTLIGDRFRIEHVYMNLLSNAIKFSPYRGKVTTKVTSEPSTESPDTVELTLSVSDQGYGISSDNQKKLFTTFMQIKPGQMQQGQGHGVGLSLCKQIATLLGGTIHCESEEGIGTTFSFMVPLQLNPVLLHKPGHESGLNPSGNHNRLFKRRGGNGNGGNGYVGGGYGAGGGGYGGGGGGAAGNGGGGNGNGNFLGCPSNELLLEAQPPSQPPSKRSNSGSSLHLTLPFDFTASSNRQARGGGAGGAGTTTSNKSVVALDVGSSSSGGGPAITSTAILNEQIMSLTNRRKNDNDNGYTQVNPLSFSGPVLVVDDVRSNRKMLSILLGRKGIISDMAEDGQEAVDMIRKDLDYYLMIFMDNMMPHMNGVQAAEILRKIGYNGLIIGITGNVLDDDVSLYLEGGADMVLSKPLKMSELDMILRHVEEHGSQSVSEMKLVDCYGKLSWVASNTYRI